MCYDRIKFRNHIPGITCYQRLEVQLNTNFLTLVLVFKYA